VSTPLPLPKPLTSHLRHLAGTVLVEHTYVNEALGHSSQIDYFVCDSINYITDFCVFEPNLNLSDHLPLAVHCNCEYKLASSASNAPQVSKVKQSR